MVPSYVTNLLAELERFIRSGPLASAMDQDLVYSYQEIDNRNARLKIYKNLFLPDAKEVDVSFDWCVQKRLWFRKYQFCLDKNIHGRAFFEPHFVYLPEYIPIITVDFDNPLVSLCMPRMKQRTQSSASAHFPHQRVLA